MTLRFIKRNETILGTIVSTIGGVVVSLYGVNNPVPFWVTGGILLIGVLYIWYQKNMEFYRLEDIKEKHKKELDDAHKIIAEKEDKIKCLEDRIEEAEQKNLECQCFSIDVVDINVNRNRMIFSCSCYSNVIEKNQCLTIYKMDNGYSDILGFAVVEQYDILKNTGQAQIAWLDPENKTTDIIELRKENTHLHPWLDFKIFLAAVGQEKRRREKVDEE